MGLCKLVFGCKHTKLDNSWSMYQVKVIQNHILKLSILFITHTHTKPSNLCWQNQFFKNLHILKDGASDDIEQVIVLKLFELQ